MAPEGEGEPSSSPKEPTEAERGASSAPASEPGRKERVLHTRVPAVLERELKRFAENLRVPVSNLVRVILEDAVLVADAATDRVETRLRDAATQLGLEREKLKKKVRVDPLAGVIAFQAVRMAQQGMCAQCQKDLPRGTRAHLGLMDPQEGPPAARVFVCDACLPGGDAAASGP